MSLTGKIKPLPKDRGFAEQLMRPIFIIQLIFAGFMACTSIFYFLSILGYEYLSKANTYLAVDQDALDVTAQSLISYPVSLLFLRLPGLSQFYYQGSSLSFIAGTLALAFALPLKKAMNTLICLALYAFNFYSALTSGFKEPIIISVLVLGIFLYPNYKTIVTAVFVPALVILFIYLPTYVNSFRANAWIGDENAKDASKLALDASLNPDDQDETNWNFLVFRISEIDMFTKFVKSTPEKIDFYGVKLLEQSCIAIVPRILWPSKPVTEDLVMQRVYDAGVVYKNSNVSAKPAFIVDAYLTIKAEELFGGYVLGTALIFSGLFQIFWRGLSFEFLINTVFWSYVCAAYKPAFIYGGPTMSVSMLSEQLLKAGIKVMVFTTTANGKHELDVIPNQSVLVDGVAVCYFSRLTKDHSHFSPALLKKFWNEVADYDLVHIHAWWNLVSVFTCLLALVKNVPVVVSPRGTLSLYSFGNKHSGMKWFIHRFIGKPLLRRSHLHTTSEREKEAVAVLIKPRSIAMLPNFVKLPRYPGSRQSRTFRTMKLIFLARIEEKKGLDILIRALPLINVPFLLTITGHGAPGYVEALKQLAVEMHVAQHIHWTGFQQENKFNILAEHDLFVLPSHDENFGNAVIESLSVGTAVLVSKEVGLAGYVEANNLGWVCSTDPGSVAGAINLIAAGCDSLNAIRREAPDLIYRDFHEDNLYKDYGFHNSEPPHNFSYQLNLLLG
eukprot:gene13984-14101_t